MTLEEAIEIINDLAFPVHVTLDQDDVDALKLCIEASNRYKLMRENPGSSWDFYLPGETED